jgi:uncharacterized protein YbbC (DUF1343 family)
VTDRAAFRPVLTGVALIGMFRRFAPDRELWRQPPYEYEHTRLPFEILSGSGTLREQIEAGMDAMAIAATWRPDEEAFMRRREKYLLY